MAHIFLSYASQDREQIRPLVETLTDQGWTVWWDRDLIAGNDFDEEIEQALKDARCVIVAWSEHSVHSRWCRDEATEGIERGVLVPLRLDDTRPPLSFRGAHTADLSGWPEQIGELEVVIAGVRQCLGDSKPNVVRPTKRTTIGNLKAHPTSFVGRAVEVAELVELMDVHRLVTLTGVGGVGKTRLSQRVAGELTATFPDGVYLVELAPVSDPAVVPDAVASTLGITPRADRAVTDGIAEALAGRRLLLLLDNCEHVLDAAADLVEILMTQTETVAVIATSREGLGVPAEHLWPVPSLDVNTGESSAAVSLFVERARAANPRFELNEVANIETVTEICTHLDGIALAIELAAARMVSMNPQELLERLGDRFRLLSGSRRGLARHQTLRNTVQWSYDLLTEDERTLLRRCSVFSGGFQIAAVTNVCGDGLDEYAVLDLLDSLVRKSLITTDLTANHTRYGLLETIRQFAEQQLGVIGAFDEMRSRHARYFAEQATAYWEMWDGPQQGNTLEWVKVEFANLRSGFRFATKGGDLETATAIAAHTTMLAWASERYEPAEWAEEILPAATQLDLRQLPRLYTAASICAFLGRTDKAIDYAQAAQVLDRNPSYEGFAPEFSPLLEANAYLYLGRADRSLKIYADVAALPGRPKISGQAGMLFALSSLGRTEEAIRLAEGAVAAAESHGNPYWIAWSLWGFAQTFTKVDPARALSARRQGLIYSREHQLPFWEHLNAIEAANLETIHGEVDRGLILFDDTIDAFHRSGDVASLALTLESLERYFRHAGFFEAAATVQGARKRIGGDVRNVTKADDKSRDVLGSLRYDECVARGAAMSVRDGVEFARQQIQLARQQATSG